jgi:hypothetical protein
MLSLVLLAQVRLQVGNEEDAIWITAPLDILGRERLYVACDGVLERDVALQSVKRELSWRVVARARRGTYCEGVELVVLIGYGIWIWKRDGEDANACGGCITHVSAILRSSGHLSLCDVLIVT